MAQSWQYLVASVIILSGLSPSELARSDHLLGNKTECQSVRISEGGKLCCNNGQALFQFGPPDYQAYFPDYQYAVAQLALQMDVIQKFFKIKETKGWEKRWADYVLQKYFPRRQRTPLVTDLIAQTTTTKNLLTMALLQAGDADDQNPVMWTCLCKFWEKRIRSLTGWKPRKKLPATLTELVADCIKQVGREKHGRNVFFASLLSSLKVLPPGVVVLKPTGDEATTGPTLSIANVELSEDEVASLAKIFPYLLHLKELKLGTCKIKTEGVAKIAEQLHFLQHLENINLHDNDIGDEGVKKLAEKFHLLKKLKKLSLDENSISSLGGAAVAENVTHLQALERLFLGQNKIASSLPSMARAFVKMPQLRRIGLEYLPYEGEDDFATSVEHVREATAILCGSIRLYRTELTLYEQTCGKNVTDSALMDRRWEAVKKAMKLRNNIVVIQSGNLKISVSLGTIV